jgi:hypothetical protein
MQRFDHAAEPPDRDRFAELLVEGIRQAGEKAPVKYDPEAFSLRSESPSHKQAQLNSVYKEYCISAPDVRANLVRNFIRSWFIPLQAIPDDFEDVQPDLLPAVRSRGSIEVSSLRLRAESGREALWPYRPLGEHLSLSLVYDLPESIASIQQSHLDRWNITFDQALARARANLADLGGGQPLDRAAPGVWRSPWRDNHDTARLVLLDLIRAHEVEGDPVAMVPNRDTLLLTGCDSTQGLVRLGRLAEEAWQHPRNVSGFAFRLQGEEWVPFLPHEIHPAYSRLHRLRLQSLAGDSNSQQKALEAWYEREDEDVYVSPCSVATAKDSGDSFSFCVWTDTVDASLPVSEVVYFVRVENEQPRLLGQAPWVVVQKHLGNLMTSQDLYPPRFRVKEFPSGEQLAAMLADTK